MELDLPRSCAPRPAAQLHSKRQRYLGFFAALALAALLAIDDLRAVLAAFVSDAFRAILLRRALLVAFVFAAFFPAESSMTLTPSFAYDTRALRLDAMTRTS